MPRVLFVVPHLSNSMRLLADYLRYLDPAFEVTVLAFDEDRRFEGEFPANATKLFAPRTERGRLLSLPTQFRSIFRAARDQDLLLCWMELTPAYLTTVVGWLRSKPVIGWVHAHLSRVFALKQRPGIWHRPLMKLFYPRLQATVGCSHGVGNDLREHFGLTNATSVPNGIDVERVQRLAQEPVPRSLHHVFAQPVLINIAALHFQKNQRLLLRAHAELMRQGLKYHLLFVGNGPLEEELRAFARELGVEQTVFFAGYVNNPYPLLHNARAFVLSSHWEGLPLVVAEALACGTPVVSTDCPSGPREILDDGKYGKLVPVDQLDPLVEALHQVLTDEDARRQMQAMATEGAQRMSIIPRARQMERILWDALQASGRKVEADEEAESAPAA